MLDDLRRVRILQIRSILSFAVVNPPMAALVSFLFSVYLCFG
jgi:hypothetical protein